MRLSRLKWVFLGTALVFLGIIEVSRRLIQPYLDSWGGHLIMSGVVLTCILFYFGATFELISRMQERLERQNRELLALHEATSDIYGEVALESVLQKVVDQARQLSTPATVPSRWSTRRGTSSSSSSPASRPRWWPGSITRRAAMGCSAWCSTRASACASRRWGVTRARVGFPEGHPPMRSLLAVPVSCKGPFRGNLYLADKETAAEFSKEDEETLERFAGAAGIAIDNVYLYQRTQAFAVTEERLRIAREMHDGMAQVVAYVNTKAQAVQAFLEKGEPRRGGQAARASWPPPRATSTRRSAKGSSPCAPAPGRSRPSTSRCATSSSAGASRAVSWRRWTSAPLRR